MSITRGRRRPSAATPVADACAAAPPHALADQSAALRVLIADDDPRFGETVRALLDAQENVEVVALARDADEAIALAGARQPNVLLLDVRMPNGGGRRVAAELRADEPSIAIAAISGANHGEDVLTMLAAGATGYLVKGASAEEIVDALRVVRSGRCVLCPDAASSLSRTLGEQGRHARLAERLVENPDLAIYSLMPRVASRSGAPARNDCTATPRRR